MPVLPTGPRLTPPGPRVTPRGHPDLRVTRREGGASEPPTSPVDIRDPVSTDRSTPDPISTPSPYLPLESSSVCRDTCGLVWRVSKWTSDSRSRPHPVSPPGRCPTCRLREEQKEEEEQEEKKQE